MSSNVTCTQLLHDPGLNPADGTTYPTATDQSGRRRTCVWRVRVFLIAPEGLASFLPDISAVGPGGAAHVRHGSRSNKGSAAADLLLPVPRGRAGSNSRPVPERRDWTPTGAGMLASSMTNRGHRMRRHSPPYIAERCAPADTPDSAQAAFSRALRAMCGSENRAQLRRLQHQPGICARSQDPLMMKVGALAAKGRLCCPPARPGMCSGSRKQDQKVGFHQNWRQHHRTDTSVLLPGRDSAMLQGQTFGQGVDAILVALAFVGVLCTPNALKVLQDSGIVRLLAFGVLPEPLIISTFVWWAVAHHTLDRGFGAILAALVCIGVLCTPTALNALRHANNGRIIAFAVLPELIIIGTFVWWLV